MGTRRTDILIRMIRRQTNNEDWGANAGITDSQIVEYINDGLSFLEEGITSAHAMQFVGETFIDLVAGQEKYDLPVDFLQGGGVLAVQYALDDPSGSNPNWKRLNQTTEIERSSGYRTQIPDDYTVVGKQIWLRPIPTSSKTSALRVLYVKRLSRMDIRRGTVATVSLNTSAKTITTLTVSNLPTPDDFANYESCCVVDADGNIKMANIKLSGSAVSSGNVPVRSDFVYQTGETISVGNYFVFGASASTHQLDLDPSVERFLTAYAAWRVFRDDSNTDSSEQLGELTSMRDSILAAYEKPNQDLILIPEVG